jgi:hypothetical protein
MQLQNEGLKYNLLYKHKRWIKTLAIEGDTAIIQLNETEQIHTRQTVKNNLQKIINKKTEEQP